MKNTEWIAVRFDSIWRNPKLKSIRINKDVITNCRRDVHEKTHYIRDRSNDITMCICGFGRILYRKNSPR
jgi:hypothetical protein